MRKKLSRIFALLLALLTLLSLAACTEEEINTALDVAEYLLTEDTDSATAVETNASTQAAVQPEKTAAPDPTATPKATATPKPTSTPKPTATPKPTVTPSATETSAKSDLKFRNAKLLNQHYEKHGIEMGFATAAEYEAAAVAVVSNPNALHKTEKEDGDEVYYVEASNEFVIVSTDGYIRTYFLPSAGRAYYERQ